MKKRIQQQDRIYEYDEGKHKLGSGSFADVYKGIMISTQEEVAIKVIKKGALKRYGDDIIKAIGSEVNILQELSNLQSQEQCPFIVKIFDCFETQNHIYIVLEFCNDGNLLDIIKAKKKIPESEAALMLYQVVCSIDYLAKRGVAHRDIKPENIFIHQDPNNQGIKMCKLGDFGFASQKNLFQTSLGTYPYMAPEFFTETSYSLSVDVWAIGVMYHEMLFGELYFIGTSQLDVSNKIINKPYVIQKAHLITPESQDFLMRCIEKNQNNRIKAEQAKNHPLFANIRLDPKITKIYQTQVQTSPIDKVLDQIVYIRNSCLFLIDLVEELEESYPEECRFDIYYLIRKAVYEITQLHMLLSQEILPKFVECEIQDWKQFIGSKQYINTLNTLQSDKQALYEKFLQYYQYFDKFLKTNFSQQYQALQKVINLETTMQIDQSLLTEQLSDSYNYFKSNFDRGVGLQDENKSSLMFSFKFLIAMNVDKLNTKKEFDFEEFEANKSRLDVNQIKDRIQKILFL